MKNYPQSLRLILATCAVAGMAKIAAAQAVAPAPTKSGSVSTSEEAAVVLNPFTVSTQRDTGFVAASSLAGGRLASDLRDTAADYSVLTRDFIDALNLTDLADATRWTVNSYDLGDSGDSVTFGGSLGNTNASQLRFRGLATNTPQLDFFPANYDYDSFSIERLDYARGASGVLFGTGSFSGTPNGVLKRARTDKTFGEVKVVEHRVGSSAGAHLGANENHPKKLHPRCPLRDPHGDPFSRTSSISRGIQSRSRDG